MTPEDHFEFARNVLLALGIDPFTVPVSRIVLDFRVGVPVVAHVEVQQIGTRLESATLAALRANGNVHVSPAVDVDPITGEVKSVPK